MLGAGDGAGLISGSVLTSGVAGVAGVCGFPGVAGEGKGMSVGTPGVKGAAGWDTMEGGEARGGGGGLCLAINIGNWSLDTVLNFNTNTSIILTRSSFPFPLSCSDLALKI